MGKKDYRLIAKVVATIMDDTTKAEIFKTFCNELRADNPKFNAVFFIRACCNGGK